MTRPRIMQCEEVVANLFVYLDGEIDQRKRAEIDRHIEECHGCCSRAEFERALRKRVGELGREKATESMRTRIRALIDEF